jgi:predicted AAA+ superfamily ATPase
METSLLELVVNEQLENFTSKSKGIKRDVNLNVYVETEQIVIISGIRRCGKSTLLSQIASDYTDFHYLNFDDERLIQFEVDDFQKLMTVWHKRSASKVLFLDEIQNILQWERFVRRIHDQGYKIYLTGSNAHLLSSELSTHLTGRYLKIDLYPFSFYELIRSQNIEYSAQTTQVQAKIVATFDKYLAEGGFPEWHKSNNTETLQNIYDDILYRDVVVRYKIQELKTLRLISSFLMTNVAKVFSYESISKMVGIKSTTTIKNYTSFLESVFLLFEVYKYDYSLKKQFVSNKKIFSIDNGLRNQVAFKHSADSGRLLENLIYIELRRRRKKVFYFKEKNECDFILEHNNSITEIIQVCYQLNSENETREFKGLTEAAQIFNLKKGLLITYDQEKKVVIGNLEIQIVSAWKWLLERD